MALLVSFLTTASSRMNAIMVSPARADPPFPVESLPDDVLALVLRSLARTSFRHALVSKRWYRLATSALSHLTIRHQNLSMQEIRDSDHFRNAQLAWLPLPRLLSALRRFPTLTHVSLGEFSIVSADGDALIRCLAATCPFLSHLTVEHQFRMAVTVDGLASLFHGCRKLRELRLLTTDGLPHLPPSLSLLTDLQTLHVCAHPLYGDDSLQELVSPPESIGALQQLRELRVSAGSSFQGLGECVGRLTDLRKLSIGTTHLSRTVTKLPDAIGDLDRLESLEVELDGLECIPESLQLLTGLKSLSLQSKRLQRLPGNVMAGLTQLQSLSLHACDSLGILPESICFLPLSSLSISSCSSLISLPHHIGALSHLETLKLLSLDNIRVLPESLGDLPQLITLELDLPALEHLPERFLAERVIIGALFSMMEVISLPLLTVRELIEPSSAVTHASAGAESGSPVAAAVPLLLVVAVLLMPLLPSAWLYPAMLLAAALLLVILVPIRAFDVASNGTEQHPGLFSLTILKVSDCLLISSLPKNFSFPALHTLTLHSLGVPKNLLDLSSRQLPQLQRLVLERMGAEADPWLFDRIPGVRSGRMRLFLHVKALFVLLHVVDLLLQLVVLLMRAATSLNIHTMPFIPFPSRFNAMVSPARADPPFPVDRLPDDVLALVLRSLAQTSFRHALVSKRWYRLATSALSHLTIRHRDLSMQEIRDSEHFRNAQLAWLPLPRLLSVLRRFPTLTHVSLSEFSIVSADGDALFQCLAATCPLLSHLTVEHQFRMVVTVDGLASLFHGCRKLREFRLLTTFCLPHLPPSLSLLTDLQTLHVCAHPLYGDDSLQELVSPPESIGALQQLRELRISAGTSFQGLGECVDLITNLRKLSIGTLFARTITRLPDAIGDLARLESLEIELDGLECIPESFQLLTGLKTLFLQSENLQCLPENVMAGLTQLRSLSLHACNSLKILPESICFLPLSSLSISSCSSLTSLPHHIGALSHLQTLKLLHLDNIRDLPESLVFIALSTAQYIRPSVLLVPAAVLAFAGARSGSAIAFVASLLLVVVLLLMSLVPTAWLYPAMLFAAALLVFLAEQHPGLVSLAVLKVSNCPLISSLPENFSFPALHTLTLHSLGNLKNHLNFAPRQLPKLQYLDLEQVDGDAEPCLPDCCAPCSGVAAAACCVLIPAGLYESVSIVQVGMQMGEERVLEAAAAWKVQSGSFSK
ncbi:unnamed protein product [Closterium sp. Naga37s-1]|nr:unnamed protein product [Closterium sp. Naga37s-1]